MRAKEKNRSWLEPRRALLAGLMALGAFALPAAAQDFSRSFRVSPEMGELEVINKKGSVTVVAAEGAQIVVTARGPREAGISATQTPQGRVKVEVMGSASVDFVINVPPHSALDLLCYKGPIKVKNTSGQIVARTIEGDIQLTGVRSPRVEANSASGNVRFSGEILPSGSYTLKSISGRVEATLPSSADFKLRATSFRGGMDLGGFSLNFNKQTEQVVEGVAGEGRAAIYLWTQEGSIHLHRKP
jgi:hypothetical protein